MGGTNIGSGEFEKAFGTPYTGQLANPTKPGHTFEGWYTDKTFTTRYDKTKDDIYIEGTVAYGIYAMWKPITYTISYNANGGTVSPTSDTKTYATNLSLAVQLELDMTLMDGIKTTTQLQKHLQIHMMVQAI